MSDALLEIEDYGGGFCSETGELIPVLHEVSYRLKTGMMTAVVGESGSGKSLVALSVLGIQPPAFERSSGRILFRGVDLLGLDEKAMRAYPWRARSVWCSRTLARRSIPSSRSAASLPTSGSSSTAAAAVRR